MNRRQLLQGSFAASVAASIPNAYGRRPAASGARRRHAVLARQRARHGARSWRPSPTWRPTRRCPTRSETHLRPVPLDPFPTRPRPVARRKPWLRGAVLPSRIFLQGQGRHLRSRRWPARGRSNIKRDDFSFGEGIGAWPDGNLGFAGFRLHAPINKPDYYDEVCVFLGASYFRAVAKSEVYGLSARGLAIDTGEARARSSRCSRRFGWSGRRRAPIRSSSTLCSTARARRAAFASRSGPGATTIFDVEAALYPRVEIAAWRPCAAHQHVLCSVPTNAPKSQDFRPQVHDSDGLMMLNGRGEELWRPLCNPHNLQVSAFADTNPRSFGLVQRDKNYAAYQDLEFDISERRPSLFVEPIGDWGEGRSCCSRFRARRKSTTTSPRSGGPKQPAAAKSEYIYTYRLHWGPDIAKTDVLARFMPHRRLARRTMAANYSCWNSPATAEDARSRRRSRASSPPTNATFSNIVAQPNPETGGWRLSFQLGIKDQTAIELRAISPMNDARRSPRSGSIDGRRTALVAASLSAGGSPLALAPARLRKPGRKPRTQSGGASLGVKRAFVFARHRRADGAAARMRCTMSSTSAA